MTAAALKRRRAAIGAGLVDSPEFVAALLAVERIGQDQDDLREQRDDDNHDHVSQQKRNHRDRNLFDAKIGQPRCNEQVGPNRRRQKTDLAGDYHQNAKHDRIDPDRHHNRQHQGGQQNDLRDRFKEHAGEHQNERDDHHGIMGKANHYEHALGVPLLMSGAGVPVGKVVEQISSHVDLFPTIAEAVGVELREEDQTLPGSSLWPAVTGMSEARTAFAEYHAMGALNAGFAYRSGRHKLIYHVGMPSQLFDLEADPLEERDLMLEVEHHPVAKQLEAELRLIVDPEDIDRRAKADQLAHAEKFGGVEEVAKAGVFSASPIPGKQVELEKP